MACDTPVLLLVFNRPDKAARVFERIRMARPARLFVAADGPRDNHPEDGDACRRTREMVVAVDWPCHVQTLFRAKNLGCGEAVSTAITWFFEQVEEGIVLEDDCVPSASFFRYCAELLERYRHDERVTTIGGMGYPRRGLCGRNSYSFSSYQLIWGWATWRRAWNNFNRDSVADARLEDIAWLERRLGRRHAAQAWSQIVARYRDGHIDTWDYPWNFSCWLRDGLCTVPAVNLIDNIGFEPEALHTRKSLSPLATAAELGFPLRHPRSVRRNKRLDREYSRLFLAEPRPWTAAGRKIARTRRALEDQFRWNAKTLRLAISAGKAHARARRHGLQDDIFYRFGREVGWRLFFRRSMASRGLLMCPVGSTRYFEFDFAARALGSVRGAARNCLDVSSPFLFSFFQAARLPDCRITMVNPDVRDANATREMLRRLRIQGIECVTAGVELLETEMAGRYDAIWSISVIEHIAGDRGDDRDAVRLMWRALRPGGLLILTVPSDKLARDEYRDDDPYGTQPKSAASGAYFFQRFYDEQAIQTRIVDEIGCAPARIEWFGEKEPGHFNAYIDRWRREGAPCTVNDPLDIAMNYQRYPSHSAMPGVGVCGLSFVKP